jgi:hypothetical protein
MYSISILVIVIGSWLLSHIIITHSTLVSDATSDYLGQVCIQYSEVAKMNLVSNQPQIGLTRKDRFGLTETIWKYCVLHLFPSTRNSDPPASHLFKQHEEWQSFIIHCVDCNSPWCGLRWKTITKPPFCNWTLLIFFCSFLIPLSLQKYRDLGETSLSLCLHFHLETLCPLFIVIGCRGFWTYLFAICWTAEFKVRPDIPKRHATQGLGRCNAHFVSRDWNSGGFAVPSLKIIKHWQLCSDLSRDSYITYRTCNEVD